MPLTMRTTPSAIPCRGVSASTAAAAASTRGAPAEAIGYLKRALAEPPPAHRRPTLMLELGGAQMRLRDTAQAQVTLRTALALKPSSDIRSALSMLLSHACYLAGEPTAALDVLEQERELEHDERRRPATVAPGRCARHRRAHPGSALAGPRTRPGRDSCAGVRA